MTISIKYGIAADTHFDLSERQVRDLIPSIEAEIAKWYPDATVDVTYVTSTGAAGGCEVYAEDSADERAIKDSVRETVYAMIEAADISAWESK